MARKIIDIGTVGNDGTGDSIRESFRKVNDNFRELYSSLGLGERLTFSGLSDTPDTFVGFENTVLSVNSTETGVVFKALDPGVGINLDLTTDPSKITINSEFAAVSGDPNPQLGGDLSTQSGARQYRILDLGDDDNPLVPQNEHEAVNKAYADRKVSLAGIDTIDPITGTTDPSAGVMTGPLVLSRNPIAEDDTTYNGLVAATKAYVDNSAFGSSVNLYVATSGQDDRPDLADDLQGRALAYAYRSLEAALKKAEEILLEAPDEIGPYKKVLTYNNGANNVTLAGIDSSPASGTGFAGTVFMSVDTVELVEEFPGVNFRVGDILTLVGGTFEEAARFEVLATRTNPGQIVSLRIISTGRYTSLPGSLSLDTTSDDESIGANAKVNVTYKVASVEVTNGGSGYGLVSVRVTPSDSIGTGAFGRATVVGGEITGVTITDGGTGFISTPDLFVDLPRFLLRTDGNRTDFTGDITTDTPAAIAGRDIREGLFLRGETSGAIAQILAHTGALDSDGNEIFDVDIKSGAFQIDEIISYGDVSKSTQISVLVESGIYEENYPLKVPQNVAIIGNEFRRTIIRPKPGPSSSPWAFQKFKRPLTVDGNVTATQPFGYHYLTDSTQPVYPLINNKGDYTAAAELIRLNKKFIQNEVVAWINNQVENAISPFDLDFEYDDDRCKRDVGLIVDSLVFDLKYGGQARTISAALKYNDTASGRIAITTQLSETVAAIQRINVLIQLILQNVTITEIYQPTTAYPQTVDNAFVAEPGVGGSSVNISDITTDTPLLITTSTPHNFTDGQNVVIAGVGGPFELNGDDYFVKVVSPTTLYLYENLEDIATDDASGTPDNAVDGSQLNDYTSGGTITDNNGIVGDLIDAIIDIVSNSGAANTPKDNDELDVFLCNDAVILRAMTGQGHGGFMMVLDPEGQILAKSPYCQESASFSRSTGQKTFAGGMFVDGFTGNLQFNLIADLDGDGTRMQVSGLERFPQLPASFIVNDQIYRINYVRNFIFNVAGSTAEFVLDEGTPYTGPLADITVTITPGSPAIFTTASEHQLDIGATVTFESTGSLPTGIDEGTEYYVVVANLGDTTFSISDVPGGSPINLAGAGSGTITFRRIFEILMPGNRSMLSNDYTQVNDLGYGLIATNGGLTEAVSMFTYYCQISYLSLGGGQIRSIGGSSAHGNFALVAEGSDPLEVPVPVTLYHELNQGATVVNTGAATENKREGIEVYAIFDDYLPLPGSEIEVNQNGSLTRYSLSTVEMIDEATNLCKLNISSSGGLNAAISNGVRITIRQNSYVVLTGDVVDVSTRPSTALVLRDSNFIYRVLDFSEYDDTYDFDDFEVASITAATEAVVTTTVPHRQQAGYQIQFETTGNLPDPIDTLTVYYVLEDGLTDTEFKISTSPDGTPVDTSGATQSGTHTVVPYGLALTQLRSNYDYIEFNIAESQPFETPASLTSCTISTGTPGTINAVGHGLAIGDQIKFTATSAPPGLSLNTHYWVTTENYGTNSFSVTTIPPIESTLIGVQGALSGNTISGLADTSNISIGDIIVPKADLTDLELNGDGVTATATFAKRRLPPYLPGQEIVITNGVAYNGTYEVLTCDNESFTFASVATGTVGPATSSVSVTGSLGSAPVVLNIPTSTTLTISTTGSSDGSVVFDIETPAVEITGTGSDVEFGKVLGDQGTNQIAVENINDGDTLRIQTGITGTPYEFSYYGEIYKITAIDTSNIDYTVLTLDNDLLTSAVFYPSSQTLKAGLGVPSLQSRGTLTIRISLTRATSHDFLEIGTGSYADTNYPNEIFGPAVNNFRATPLFATDEDEDGNTVTTSQVQERSNGRVFFVSTDQFGNFSVGPFFKVDQGTGSVTFSASLALSQLDGLGFKRGAVISEFSVDDTMADAAADAVPVESAVRGYIDKRLGLTHSGGPVLESQIIPTGGGFLALGGQLAMKNDLNVGDNRLTNVADPVNGTDGVNLQSLIIANFDEFDVDGPNANDILVFTGDQNNAINATVVGDIAFGIDSTAGTIDAQIQPEVITNADIDPAADIVQSKLDLTLATARASAPTGTDAEKQAASGVSSYNNAEFTITDGFVTLKSNGITLGKIQKLAADTVIGNSTGASATPTEVSFATVVNEGLALKKSNFTTTGFIRRKSVSSFTGDTGTGIGDSYEMVDSSSINTADTLVKRDSQGNFAAGTINAGKLQLDSIDFADTFASGGNVGATTIYGYLGNAAITLSDGPDVADKNSFYDNESHSFRKQNGINYAPIICSGITAQSLSTGGTLTNGTVEGQWSLGTGSRFEATYADLAEYYEGDTVYEVGTVLIFGGEKEVTACSRFADTAVAGVVSNSSAYSMNSQCPGYKNLIALQGRVPVKVVGKIRKGDLITTSEIEGVGTKALEAQVGTILGKALQDYDSTEIGIIEVAVGRS